MAEVDYIMSRPFGEPALRKMSGLTIQTTDLNIDSFPDYVDPFLSSGETMTGSPLAHMPAAANRQVGKLKEKDDPARHPSPQPTHFSVPQLSRLNGHGHRTLRKATLGYEAPKFVGKPEQMTQGESPNSLPACLLLGLG